MDWEDIYTYVDIIAQMNSDGPSLGSTPRPAGAKDDRAAFTAFARANGG